MVAQQRAYNAKQEAEQQRRRNGALPTVTGDSRRGAADPPAQDRQFDHPGALESMIPIWGSGKEALADLEDKNYVGAAVNAGLAVSDVMLAKAVVGGLAKGGLKLAGPYVWRMHPKQGQGARQWLGDKGFVKPGQPAHHWWIEQKSKVPDWIKNQPPFIKPTRDAVEHGRIHGPYTVDGVKLPRFNDAQRLWYGTPQWAKAAYVSSAGHSGAAAGRAGADEASLTRPRR
jgi:hypothetical protein